MSKGWRELQRSFLAGSLVVVPMAASIFFVLWVFRVVTGLLLPPVVEAQDATLARRLLVLAGFVVLTTLVGWVMRWVVGKRLMAATDRIISRVPLWNRTYGFIKDVSETFLGEKASVFHRVVVVEYPRPGLYTLAFATADTGGEVDAKTNRALVSVFLPTPPNPTTGYLALFPRERLVDLEMSVADAMKMAFSGGAVVPPYPAAPTAQAGAAG